MMPLKPLEFENALKLGLGRAILHLQHVTQPTDYRDVVLTTCLEFGGYDPQVEGMRTEYLFQAAQLTEILPRLRQALLERLENPDDDSWDALQRLELLAQFAREGDEEARVALRGYYLRLTHPHSPIEGIVASILLHLDGVQAFLFVIRQLGRVFQIDLEKAEDNSFLNEARELMGQQSVALLLEQHGQEPEVMAYLERIEHTQQRRQERKRQQPPQQPQPYSVARAWAEERPEFCGKLLNWGWMATDEELLKAAQDVVLEQDPEILASLLCIFRNLHRKLGQRTGRAFPLGPLPLISLAWHSNSRVAERAAYMLEAFVSAEVRQTALELLKDAERVSNAIALFKLNFAPGDEAALEAGLHLVTTERPDYETAEYVRQFIDVVRGHPNPAMLALLVQAYVHLPCAHCRETLVLLLEQHRALPEWLAEEAALDARQEMREYFRARATP